jgi:protein-disulfide isomerase
VLKQILQTYPNDVKVVFKQFPLVTIHQYAKPAALASIAAQKQNKFWEMHDLLYQNQRALDAASLRRYAESLGLDMTAYDKVVADPETSRFLDQDMLEGQKAGVQGTPTFFVDGVQSPNWDIGTMQRMVDAAKSGEDVSVTAGQIRAAQMAAQAANQPKPPDPNQVYQIDIAGAPVRGAANAPVTIVEFSDYQCPFCANAEPLWKQVMEAYPNKVRFVYKQFPLSFHQNARSGAAVALFAKEHGKYWEMHDLLFQNNQAMNKSTPEQILDVYRGYAKQLGLDEKALESAIKSEAYKSTIEKDVEDGKKAAVQGTPSVFINGKRVQRRDFETIKGMIDVALQSGGATPSSN